MLSASRPRHQARSALRGSSGSTTTQRCHHHSRGAHPAPAAAVAGAPGPSGSRKQQRASALRRQQQEGRGRGQVWRVYSFADGSGSVAVAAMDNNSGNGQAAAMQQPLDAPAQQADDQQQPPRLDPQQQQQQQRQWEEEMEETLKLVHLLPESGEYLIRVWSAASDSPHLAVPRSTHPTHITTNNRPPVRTALESHDRLYELLEVVMDLGRPPLARFPSGDVKLSDDPVTAEDLAQAVEKVGGCTVNDCGVLVLAAGKGAAAARHQLSNYHRPPPFESHATPHQLETPKQPPQVGDFGGDNRAGIDATLHRISAMRNRAGKVVGLTCRVGRAITGSAELVRDLICSGASILFLGRPGVGKTTAIRELSRLCAEDLGKRVVIVDTSNEIGGDGDVPHAGIGRARRMQVPDPEQQHRVMIEAVENHTPQVKRGWVGGGGWWWAVTFHVSRASPSTHIHTQTHTQTPSPHHPPKQNQPGRRHRRDRHRGRVLRGAHHRAARRAAHCDGARQRAGERGEEPRAGRPRGGHPVGDAG
jgi:hypothetical protein